LLFFIFSISRAMQLSSINIFLFLKVCMNLEFFLIAIDELGVCLYRFLNIDASKIECH
jgi:hypothetical protein